MLANKGIVSEKIAPRILLYKIYKNASRLIAITSERLTLLTFYFQHKPFLYVTLCFGVLHKFRADVTRPDNS